MWSSMLSGLWWTICPLVLTIPAFFCEQNLPHDYRRLSNRSLHVKRSEQKLRAVLLGWPSWTETLNLSFNNLSAIHWTGEPPYFPHATTLILSQNSISRTDKGAFAGFPELEELDLSHNKLSVVTEGTLQGLKRLKNLNLGHNHLHRIHSRGFNDLLSLEKLWLRNNRLGIVPDAVNKLAALKILSLSTNHISRLHSGNFHGCQELKMLRLEENQICSVSEWTFLKQENLKVLDLSSNQLDTLPETTVKFLWERGVDVHLHGNPMKCECGLTGQHGRRPAWLTDVARCDRSRTLAAMKVRSSQASSGSLRLSETVVFTVNLGSHLTMPCRDSHNGDTEGIVQFWKTPLAWLESRSSSDHLGTLKTHCNGSLTISNVTSLHGGLYYCLLVDGEGRAIVSYRVRVANSGYNRLIKSRKTREAGFSVPDPVSDGHFASAVVSSVLVTFIGGFAIGAISRSHVIKCLQVTRSHIPALRRKHQKTDGAEHTATTLHSEQHIRSYWRETSVDSVVFSITNSPPPKAPRSFRAKKEVHEGREYLEGCDQAPPQGHNSEADSSGSGTTSRGTKAGMEDHGDSASGDEIKLRTAKRGRVIKLYNYDEEGNHYGHIKDQGEEMQSIPQPKQRTLSLSRLNSIMSTATSPGLNSDPENDLEEENETLRVRLEFRAGQ
ncbi:leucine-rich repeat-containing protein 4 [Denticeps clupeoides]|uniref:Ig-like domain-containing protein n=1 Tax=Denticeps clupeoides TaxID=299321 RepID=A0AAY4AU33_9TELE|nr:leucine-rich repeat-containing protein 4-like [Denticeps clupeoides]